MPLKRIPFLAVLLALAAVRPLFAAELRIGAASSDEAAAWARRIETMAAARTLSLVRTQPDGDFPGRKHLRFEQSFEGIKLWGPQLVEQLDEAGRPLTVFGRFVDEVRVDTRPALRAEQAEAIAIAHMGRGVWVATRPELVIVPVIEQLGNDRDRLAYHFWAQDTDRITCYLIDAHSGDMILAADDLQSAAVAGIGTGTHGDRKKLAVDQLAAREFRTEDRLRPPAISTYDLKFNIAAYNSFQTSGTIAASFLAMDDDNVWTDGMVVDAQAYLGWTYDYYFKRLNRRGLDDNNLRVIALVHQNTGANAFWNRITRSMVFLDGAGVYGPFSASLEVVAHEYTHGVTQHTWAAASLPQAGALNESFSDIIGTAVEWFYQPPGNGRNMADYWSGEDVSVVFDPPRYSFRSPQNPSAICNVRFCNPDHFGKYDSAFGLHANGDISNHAFYLLIEGGTNRTSGLRVQGLGAANRDRAEKIFYRGFTQYLTPTATFGDARRATIQAAADLYGASSDEVAQTIAAWTAVGVN